MNLCSLRYLCRLNLLGTDAFGDIARALRHALNCRNLLLILLLFLLDSLFATHPLVNILEAADQKGNEDQHREDSTHADN